MGSRRALLLAVVLSLVACAEAPPPAGPAAPPPVETAPAPPPPPLPPAPPPPAIPSRHEALHCDAMMVRQAGKDIAPVDGVFTLDKRPFALVHTGPEKLPSVHLSVSGALNAALDQWGEREVWGSADEYMGHDPDDLPIREGAHLITDPDGQDLFLSAMGEGYPAFFRQMVIINDEPGAILSVAKAGGGFERQGGQDVQLVRAIAGTAVAKTRFKRLHLTYFGTVSQVGPGGKGSFGSRSLLKMRWGSCQLVFP